MNKKWSIILLIVAIISIVTTISFFLLQDKKNNILSKVPNNAKSIVVIDLQALSTKLFFDELTSGSKNAGKLVKLMPDSLAAIDWLASDISLSEKAVFFTTENIPDDSLRLHVILRIADAKNFNNFMDSLSKTISLKPVKENVLWSEQFKSLIAWDSDFVVLSLFSKKAEQVAKASENILLLKKEKSIMADSSFMKKQTTDFDILFYSKPYTLYPQKHQKFIQNNIESIISLIKFNDGELELKTELKPIVGSLLDKLFDVPKKNLPISVLDSSVLKIVFNIEPKAFFQITNKLSSVKINNKKIPLLAAWDGRLMLALDGTKIIKNEYITYDYDDDFNKIELKKITKDKIWDIKAVLGINELLLDSVLNDSRIYKSKKDTLLFKGSNFILKRTGDAYLCYNHYVSPPKTQKETIAQNIYFRLDYDKLIPIIKESEFALGDSLMNKIAFDHFELNMNKNAFIDISTSLYFPDKKKNAFFSISEMFIKPTVDN